jgi:hypothetical protein
MASMLDDMARLPRRLVEIGRAGDGKHADIIKAVSQAGATQRSAAQQGWLD